MYFVNAYGGKNHIEEFGKPHTIFCTNPVSRQVPLNTQPNLHWCYECINLYYKYVIFT